MKRLIKPAVFGVIFIVCLFVINTGCKKTAAATCSAATALCGSHTFTACCSETQCYYLVDGGDQTNCNGTDCQAAAQTIVNKYCGGGFNFSKEQALETVEKVLADIK
jgi:hypothetical protein